MKKKTLFILLTAAALLMLLVGCTNIDNNSANTDNNSTKTDTASKEASGEAKFAYPANEFGQTYGTFGKIWEEYELAGELPDLVAIKADNGEQGYVYRDAFSKAYYDSFIPIRSEAARQQSVQDFIGTVDAFCKYYTDKTGSDVDRATADSIFDEIKRTSGQNCPWFMITDEQKEAIMNLFPEEHRSLTVAEEAYNAALAHNDFTLTVYALDGQTKIGEVFVVNP